MLSTLLTFNNFQPFLSFKKFHTSSSYHGNHVLSWHGWQFLQYISPTSSWHLETIMRFVIPSKFACCFEHFCHCNHVKFHKCFLACGLSMSTLAFYVRATYWNTSRYCNWLIFHRNALMIMVMLIVITHKQCTLFLMKSRWCLSCLLEIHWWKQSYEGLLCKMLISLLDSIHAFI